jgi:hypothetical protein
MKLGESDLTQIRIPVSIVDTSGAAVTGYVPSAGELQISYSGSTLATAPGSLVEIGGGAYYYQGTTADAAVEGFTLVRINHTGYRGIGWRPVTGSSGIITFPLEIDDADGLPVTGRAPSAGALHLSINGAAYGSATGTFGEIGGGAYYYAHDVRSISGFVLLLVDGVANVYKPAYGWGTFSGATTSGTVLTTTADLIRDRAIAVIIGLVPKYLSGIHFRPSTNRHGADFVKQCEKQPASAFRLFQCRDIGVDHPPEVTNTDVEWRQITLRIIVAYPQDYMANAAPLGKQALDRDRVMSTDQHAIEHAVGLAGRANFSSAVSPSYPDAFWVSGTTTREIGRACDYLVIEQTMRFLRTMP